MLARRPHVHVALGRKRIAAGLGGAQVGLHGMLVDAFAQPEIYRGVRTGVEQIVALVLRVRHGEPFLDVTAQGVNLQRQVATLDGVKEVETDRELGAEELHDVMAEQIYGLLVHERE